VTYDASADAAYMYLTGREPSVGESRSRFSSMTEINVQRSSSTFKDGLLVGVEVLGAKVAPRGPSRPRLTLRAYSRTLSHDGVLFLDVDRITSGHTARHPPEKRHVAHRSRGSCPESVVLPLHHGPMATTMVTVRPPRPGLLPHLSASSSLRRNGRRGDMTLTRPRRCDYGGCVATLIETKGRRP
jgi:uncharacterized protein YuzE